jgi:urease accessory protein UreH
MSLFGPVDIGPHEGPIREELPDGSVLYATSEEAYCLARREYYAGHFTGAAIVIPDAAEAAKRKRLRQADASYRDTRIAVSIEASRLCTIARERGATERELHHLRCDVLYASVTGYVPRLSDERRRELMGGN